MGFDNRESKHTLYRWEDFMKKFCSSLIKHATNAINFEKEKMLLLTKKRAKFTPRCNRMSQKVCK